MEKFSGTKSVFFFILHIVWKFQKIELIIKIKNSKILRRLS